MPRTRAPYEPDERDQEAADAFMRYLNRGGSPERVAAALANDHPTLQQLFMRTCVAFLRELDAKPYVDGRNEASQQAARTAIRAWNAEQDGGPYLPFI